jgi:Ca2+-transporting ATPase
MSPDLPIAPSKPARRPAHTRTAAEVMRDHGVESRGLSRAEAAARNGIYGPNILPEGEERTPLQMLLAQVSDFMILVLLAAAVISGLVGEPVDSIIIVVIVALNATLGFLQERRASKAMAALRQLSAPSARVRRDGVVETISATDLVPGDIVLLEAGNVVPADLRLIEAIRLRHAEAALTGESQPVDKSTAPLTEDEGPLGDRTCIGWKGTLVVNGRGEGVVIATGPDTELGRIARLLETAEEVTTPLQKRLARFGKRLAWVILGICALVFAINVALGRPPVEMLLTSVSLAVAAIPEALPAVVVIALALGASKMVSHHALVRRLPAVETLGSVTWICSDKTGTLTENRMRVEAFSDGKGALAAPSERLLTAMALCNDVVPTPAHTLSGDPTEVALVESASARGADKTRLELSHPRKSEFPFDSERKRMTTVHAAPDGLIAYVKGAPEAILGRAFEHLPEARLEALAEAERLARSGLRVLAFAERRLPSMPPLEDLERDLTFLGLVGLIDPPRPEAAAAVAECRSAGIVPVMITGDHPATARAIAERLGILEDGRVISGIELRHMSDETLRAEVRDIRVYARVDPEQKIRIVKALQDVGEFAAMTGDGVNDAPALKSADIGVAMGKNGTDVARESSQLVLLDDNFATIVTAIREGRRIFDNIRKFIRYVMTCNSAEVWTIFLAPLLGLPIPLLPIHILWVNLVTDGLPGLALANDPAEPNVMQRPPRAPNESIFAHGMWQHMLWVGLLMAGICLGIQTFSIASGAHWQTMVFTVLCLSQLGHALAIRSERLSVFTLGLTSNRMLLLSLVGTLALQLMTIYLPPMNDLFRTEPLTLAELLICLVASSVVFFAVEIEKWFIRRGRLYGEPASPK